MSTFVRKRGKTNSRWHPADRVSQVVRYPKSEGEYLERARGHAGFHNGAKVFVRPMNKDVGLIAARIRVARKLGRTV